MEKTPSRPWNYKGHIIESYPKGIVFKYVVWLTPQRVIATGVLAELMAALDAVEEPRCDLWANV